MNIAILTFEGFNELDSFIASGILNRMKGYGYNVQITCPADEVTSMNGVTITAQQPLEFANTADVVLFGSGIYTRDIGNDPSILNRLHLNSSEQLICGQCSGTFLLAKLGLLGDLPACTDLKSKPWIIDEGVNVIDEPFIANNNIATAGGCLASQYLAAWIIIKKSGKESAVSAIHYVAPVGEKKAAVNHCLDIVTPSV